MTGGIRASQRVRSARAKSAPHSSPAGRTSVASARSRSPAHAAADAANASTCLEGASAPDPPPDPPAAVGGAPAGAPAGAAPIFARLRKANFLRGASLCGAAGRGSVAEAAGVVRPRAWGHLSRSAFSRASRSRTAPELVSRIATGRKDDALATSSCSPAT